MQLDAKVYLVGSGWAGSNFTNHYDCDVYLVDCGGALVLIDAGAGIETERIVDCIRFHGFSLENIKYILLTHGHGDHAGGAYELAEASGAKVLAHPDCARYVSKGDMRAVELDAAIAAGGYPAHFKYRPCRTDPIGDGESLTVGGVTFEAYDTPGHCSGHNVYLARTPDRSYLFAGDSIFLGGRISLQNIWDCDLLAYAATAEKLSKLSFDALLPSHFGVDFNEGKSHVMKACEIFRSLGVPKQAP
jgi:glyoxylase-like metal-dependent hydrolase (beta-lactamase superfamily II)